MERSGANGRNRPTRPDLHRHRYRSRHATRYNLRGLTRSRALLTIGFCALLAPPARAQEIRVYSEFQRFDPYGERVAPDRGVASREILSPAIARNGHLSVHVVITAPKGTNYFLYAASNPPDLVDLALYREYFTPCGTGYCPDWVTPQPSPSFGAIPESLFELPGQNTRCYLLDIHAHADTPPRRVRVEALLKVGTWQVAPMEVRIMAPTVPTVQAGALVHDDQLAPLDAPASATAHLQLLRLVARMPPIMPASLTRLRQFTQRNAAEDALLASAHRDGFPELNLLSFTPALWPGLGTNGIAGSRFSQQSGAVNRPATARRGSSRYSHFANIHNSPLYTGNIPW